MVASKSSRSVEQRRADETLRRILEAAAARADELPETSPFLAARVKARASEERPAPSALEPLVAAAWRALPAMALAAALLAGWAGVESARVSHAQEAVVASAVTDQGLGEAALASMLLGASEQTPGGGS
jgi:hypothetical protein